MELNRKDETIRKQGIFISSAWTKDVCQTTKHAKILPAFIALEIAENSL
jgi:hypothetical protein